MNTRLAGQETIQLVLITLLMLTSYCCTIAQDKKFVYITKTGEKYHTENCHYLKYSRTEIELDKAKDRGYTACSVCKPGAGAMPKDTSNGENGTNRTVPAAPAQRTGTTTTKRCSATTQAGSQCKRTTSDSSGKCWQHQ